MLLRPLRHQLSMSNITIMVRATKMYDGNVNESSLELEMDVASLSAFGLPFVAHFSEPACLLRQFLAGVSISSGFKLAAEMNKQKIGRNSNCMSNLNDFTVKKSNLEVQLIGNINYWILIHFVGFKHYVPHLFDFPSVASMRQHFHPAHCHYHDYWNGTNHWAR